LRGFGYWASRIEWDDRCHNGCGIAL
jgi:hypothetical protein